MTSLLLAAPTSGSGKTTVTLGLLRALKSAGHIVRGAKSGPDYIDPKFHEVACGHPSVNLDAWAMSQDRILNLTQGDGLLLVEGAMGLFDGAPPDGKGSASDLAKALGIPVVLVVDASHQAQSVAALINGFVHHDKNTRVVGVIFNKVGSTRHARILSQAMAQTGIKTFGYLPRSTEISLPSRHLGLVQAQEISELSDKIELFADLVAQNINLSELVQAFEPPKQPQSQALKIPPLAQRISIADDIAFAFNYKHILDDWRSQGAELHFFSPLNDEAPAKDHFVFLPGGYPELYAGQLSQNTTFLTGLAQSTHIYGECGGYMVLGQALIDKQGFSHSMAGLLDVVTSFETPKLHLGYRNLVATQGHYKGCFKAHEFHFSQAIEEKGDFLFSAQDAEGNDLPNAGLVKGNISGSYMHVIDQA